MTTEPQNPEIEEDVIQEEESSMIRVHENVLSAIVKRTTLGVDGVVRLADGSFIDNIAEMVGRKNFDRAISVDMGESSVKRIELRIVVEIGKFIPDVAKKVQTEIVKEIAFMTGMKVECIDVTVTDVDNYPEPETELETVNAEEAGDTAEKDI